MIIQHHISNLTDPEKEQFKDYLEAKVERLRGLLEAHYPDADTVKLDAHVKKHDKHTAFEVELVLHLPKAPTIVAKEVKHTITEPMDAVTNKIEAQMVKHFEKLTRN